MDETKHNQPGIPQSGPPRTRVGLVRVTNCARHSLPMPTLEEVLIRVELADNALEVLRHDAQAGPPYAECYPFPTPEGRWFWVIRNVRTRECVVTTYADFERALGVMAEEARRGNANR